MESKEDFAASVATAKHRTNRAIEHLMGLVTGLIADGELNDIEIKMLSTWIASHPEVTSEFPGNIVARRVSEVLADGAISEQERIQLLETLSGLASTDFASTGSVTPEVTSLPIDDTANFDIRDATVCFTGEFVFGTRAACVRLMEKVGVACADNPSKKVNLLVIGTNVSPDWAHTNFGRKIQKAMELKAGGHQIHIISEQRWLQAAE